MRQALWHRHVGGVGAPPALREWLVCEGSLTARLVAHSSAFRVQRLRQSAAPCRFEEARALGLARRVRVWEREVLLRCDEGAVVFGHTVVPLSATASDWPQFGALGERSLGSTLFGDPEVARGALEFARIGASHPLMRRARPFLGEGEGGEEPVLYARRCLYRRRRGTLLVTEVFLPSVLQLKLASARTLTNT